MSDWTKYKEKVRNTNPEIGKDIDEVEEVSAWMPMPPPYRADEESEDMEREMINFDDKAMGIVKDYIMEHLDKSDPMPDFTVYTVWKCKILQNWKYLISSTLFDGMYYELTYNGDKHEWYLDAYKKFENKVIK